MIGLPIVWAFAVVGLSIPGHAFEKAIELGLLYALGGGVIVVLLGSSGPRTLRALETPGRDLFARRRPSSPALIVTMVCHAGLRGLASAQPWPRPGGSPPTCGRVLRVGRGSLKNRAR